MPLSKNRYRGALVYNFFDNLLPDSATKAQALMEDMARKTPSVIASVQSRLPKDFPDHISEPILEGLEQQARKLDGL